ncbi:hypothetical protein R3P38DRAFT_3214474 [Favolaschia claudopus]|uniref:Uncharacterized protein n=1 Tax=Favolaschia claudopus TaxID=2862362 RepID=A0AAW0ABM7_9AGAR
MTTAPPPPRRPFVPSGRLSPTSSTDESSSVPALLTPWDWSDTGNSSGEERGRWRGGMVARRGGVRRTSVSVSSSDGRYGGGGGEGRIVLKGERTGGAIESGNDDTDEGGFDGDDIPLNQARMTGQWAWAWAQPGNGDEYAHGLCFHISPWVSRCLMRRRRAQSPIIHDPSTSGSCLLRGAPAAMMIANQTYLTAVGQ